MLIVPSSTIITSIYISLRLRYYLILYVRNSDVIRLSSLLISRLPLNNIYSPTFSFSSYCFCYRAFIFFFMILFTSVRLSFRYISTKMCLVASFASNLHLKEKLKQFLSLLSCVSNLKKRNWTHFVHEPHDRWRFGVTLSRKVRTLNTAEHVCFSLLS